METLKREDLENFFSKFIEYYEDQVKKNHTNVSDKLKLFSNLPVKIELLADQAMKYCTIVISKSKSYDISFDNSFQDIFMVVAVANSKKYEYTENKSLLYLFQTNALRFEEWDIQKFSQDLISYEMAQIKK
jgi:hypothetical protein